MTVKNTIADRDLEALRAALAGRVFVAGQAGYDQARQAWNLAVDQRPSVVVEAGSASRMNMRREARNHLVFLSAQFLLGMAVDRRPVRSRGCATGTVLFRTRIRGLGTPPHSQSPGSVMTTNTDRARSAR